MVQPEGEYQVSKCLELDKASFGSAIEEALADLMDATQVYLDTPKDLGECRHTLKDKEVRVCSHERAELGDTKGEVPGR